MCEVLSPGTEALDRGEKMDLYARHAVRHLWLLHPEERYLEVHRLAADGWLKVATFPTSACVRAEPFDAVELSVGVLFGDDED